MKIIDRVAENIRSLVAYDPGKPIEEVEREYGISGSVKLASNENPLGPSPKAMAAIRQRLEQLHLYPDGDCYYLKRGLSGKLGVVPENLILGNGSNEIIELAVRTFMRPGDEVVMARQAFVVYQLVAQAAGGKAVAVPLRNFTHDLDAIADRITRATRIIFLANPNNPTGTIFTTRAWESFLNKVPEDVLIVVDEAYFEYVEDPQYPDSLRYQTEERALLSLRTFSKLYGLAGLRIGYGVGPKSVVGVMQRVRQPFNVNAVAQWGALAALNDTEHVQRTLQVNRAGMKYLEEELAKLNVSYVPSRANFVLIRVGEAQEIFKQLLRRGVIVRPMGAYEFPAYLRVTVGTMAENQRFIAALGETMRAD